MLVVNREAKSGQILDLIGDSRIRMTRFDCDDRKKEDNERFGCHYPKQNMIKRFDAN